MKLRTTDRGRDEMVHPAPRWFAVIMHSGISAAAVVAVLLNLLVNHVRAGATRSVPEH